MHYTGPLKADAPADWYKAADPSAHFAQQGGRALVTTYGYALTDEDGKRYDVVTDALGHATKTYKDAFSAASKTVFADGAFVETISGVNGAADAPPTAAEGWCGVPAGGRHEVKVAQRKDGDPVVATHSLYDRSGRLTDVWQPAVDDGMTPATDRVRPHWRYTTASAGWTSTPTFRAGRRSTSTKPIRGERRGRLGGVRRLDGALPAAGAAVSECAFRRARGGRYPSRRNEDDT